MVNRKQVFFIIGFSLFATLSCKVIQTRSQPIRSSADSSAIETLYLNAFSHYACIANKWKSCFAIQKAIRQLYKGNYLNFVNHKKDTVFLIWTDDMGYSCKGVTIFNKRDSVDIGKCLGNWNDTFQVFPHTLPYRVNDIRRWDTVQLVRRYGRPNGSIPSSLVSRVILKGGSYKSESIIMFLSPK